MSHTGGLGVSAHLVYVALLDKGHPDKQGPHLDRARVLLMGWAMSPLGDSLVGWARVEVPLGVALVGWAMLPLGVGMVGWVGLIQDKVVQNRAWNEA